MMRDYPNIGIQIPQILLPRADIDLNKWAVVACDQYTAEPEYWQKVKDIVGKAPSTLHMIFPEVYLEQPEKQQIIQNIQDKMMRQVHDIDQFFS